MTFDEAHNVYAKWSLPREVRDRAKEVLLSFGWKGKAIVDNEDFLYRVGTVRDLGTPLMRVE